MNEAQITLYLTGDSTVSNYTEARAPRAGWGQMLPKLLAPSIQVVNAAASGRSTKSFINEGRLTKVDERIGTGDYLFIQFGHNDEKSDEARHTEPYTTFKENLKQYINTARSHQAHPVLVTPVQRRSFNEAGEFMDTHGEYPSAMKQLAAELNVPLIDLASKSRALLESLGPEPSKKLFLWLMPGEHPNYPDGEQDDTHFSEYGALEMAKLIREGCRELGLPFARV